MQGVLFKTWIIGVSQDLNLLTYGCRKDLGARFPVSLLRCRRTVLRQKRVTVPVHRIVYSSPEPEGKAG